MPFYETVVVLEPTLAEEQTEAKIKDIQSIIEQKNGAIRKIERWGTRKLAYPIKHKREGIYILIEFESGSDIVNDLEKHYRIQESILRYLTLRRERPSAENYVSPLSRLAETRESVHEEDTDEDMEDIDEDSSEPEVDIEEGIEDDEEEEEIEDEKVGESEIKATDSIDTEEPIIEKDGLESEEDKQTKGSTESDS